MANVVGEKEIQTDWPVVEGIEADSKHKGRQINLVAEEKSIVPQRNKKLM